MSEIATPPSSPRSTSHASRSFPRIHMLVLLIGGCLILLQIRTISTFANTSIQYDPAAAENEAKLEHIEREKRKFAQTKGFVVDGQVGGEKIPFLDDDKVDEVIDDTGIESRGIKPQTNATIVADNIAAFCGSCTWLDSNFNCDERVEFIMKRYSKEKPTKEEVKRSIMKQGICIDPNWAPEFVDQEIASVESKMSAAFGSRTASLRYNPTLPIHNNTTTSIQNDSPAQQHPPTSLSTQNGNDTTSIDLVSLTTSKDFFILFNNSAITSWLRHIQNIRSITFIGPPSDHNLFQHNMQIHYPDLLNATSQKEMIPIRWVNETHWKTNYKNKYRCPYPNVCQQLIKLFVFDLRTKLNVDIGDNILIVDSDTVWSRDVTFVHDNRTVTYFEVFDQMQGAGCGKSDPIQFTEAITMGISFPAQTVRASNQSSVEMLQVETVTPYKACQREEYPNATGGRHIAHHMLFQYDIMMDLHSTITKAWSLPNIWIAFVKCQRRKFCSSRVAEYELYYSFISHNYPERVHTVKLENGMNYMGGSAICDKAEIDCCRAKGVLLKGCHNHRIDLMKAATSNYARNVAIGDLCC